MPLIDLTKPEVIRFLIETYDKTDRLRMRWNNLHEDMVKETATFHGDEKGWCELDVAKKMLEAGMLATTRDHIISGSYKRHVSLPFHIPGLADIKKKALSIAELGLGDSNEDSRLSKNSLFPDPKMRPVPTEQEDILYKGLPDYGRLEYLKTRHCLAPEDKYYFEECTQWDYGWRLKDSFFGRSTTPQHGHIASMKKDTENRTGPQPDPPHYKTP